MEDGGPKLSVGTRHLFPRKQILWFFVLAFLTGAVLLTMQYREYRIETGSALQEVPDWLIGESASSPIAIRNWSDVVRLGQFVVRGGTQALSSLRNAASALNAISLTWNELSTNGLGWFLGGDGEKIIIAMKTLQEKAGVLQGAIEQQDRAMEENLGLADPVAFKVELDGWVRSLNGIIAWLEETEPHRIVILFQNPSELRPTGGFLGSFAEAVIEGGAVREWRVRDINEVTRGFSRRIVPPEPLQALITNWGPADANWFFDLPRSAKKVLEFMEDSALYAPSSTVFDGAIAITGGAVEEMLALTGPIELADGTKVSAENVIAKIQGEVVAKRESGDSAPKRILAALLARLVEKTASFSEEERAKVPDLLGHLIAEKDIMFYFRDEEFERLVGRLGAAGGVSALPTPFLGTYMAVVVSNIGGEKTDLVMEESVSLEVTIAQGGFADHHLSITRTHRGDKASEWWYRVANKSYMKIFVPVGARLTGATGMAEKKITPKANYAKGYEKDKDVEETESTKETFLSYPGVARFRESGKDAFAFWMEVTRGKKATATLDYRTYLPAAPYDGMNYEVIVETQAGLKNPYAVAVHAPLGFVWEENGLPIYEWKSADAPGKTTLQLTLKKI